MDPIAIGFRTSTYWIGVTKIRTISQPWKRVWESVRTATMEDGRSFADYA